MRLSHALSPALFLVACGAAEPELASRRECESLRDHLIGLRMTTVAADHEQHRAAIASALGDFVATCVETTTRAQLRCSLAAGDYRSLTACSEGGEP